MLTVADLKKIVLAVFFFVFPALSLVGSIYYFSQGYVWLSFMLAFMTCLLIGVSTVLSIVCILVVFLDTP